MTEHTVAMPANLPRCMRPTCVRNSEPGRRGLCRSDYAGLAELVRRKVTTWEKLEQAGRCLGKRTPLKAWALAGIA